MHPLTPDLSKLTDEELQTKLSELNKRLQFAYRSGHTSVFGQIQLLLADYQTEATKRHQKLLEEMMKANPNFKDLIDIS